MVFSFLCRGFWISMVTTGLMTKVSCSAFDLDNFGFVYVFSRHLVISEFRTVSSATLTLRHSLSSYIRLWVFFLDILFNKSLLIYLNEKNHNIYISGSLILLKKKYEKWMESEKYRKKILKMILIRPPFSLSFLAWIFPWTIKYQIQIFSNLWFFPEKLMFLQIFWQDLALDLKRIVITGSIMYDNSAWYF